jgi:ligand-binding sensor domain-containing protein/signal transduction histidine kinase/CheY-like chemotaxis protein
MSHPRATRPAARFFGPILLVLAGGAPAPALDPDRAATQYAVRVWRSEQGLPHDAVVALAQTPDGYLWCGTEHGLARFDGVTFTVFDRSNTPALRSNSIHALLTDRAGRLWVGTGGGGLVRRDGKTFVNLSTQDGLIGDTVLSLAEDPAGGVWVGTSSGLSRYADGRFTNFTDADGLPSNYCRCLCADGRARVWVGTSQGLCHLSGGRFTTVSPRADRAADIVRAVRAGRDGGLWIGIGSGMSRWKDGRFTAYGSADGLPSGSVTALREDRDGNLWVATDVGVSRWRDGRITGQFARGSTLGRTTFALLEDAAGAVWAGTADGLVRLGNGRCVPTAAAEGLVADSVSCVFEDRGGNLWAGATGGLSVRRGGKWASYTSRDGLPGDTVQAIAEDAAGDMWFGTSTGLARLRGGRFETFTTAHGLPNNSVLALFADRGGTLWIGTSVGGVSRYRGGRFEAVPDAFGLKGVIGRVFFEDAAGALWIGTNGAGVYVVRDGGVVRHTRQNGLSSDLVLSIQQDADGAVWVGTHGGGLCRFHDNRWSHVDSSRGLSDDIVYHTLDDGRHLWLSSTKGICRVTKGELAAAGPVRPLLLGKNDGMRILDCNGGTQPAGCRTRDGWLWFPTDCGLVAVNPAAAGTNPAAPPVLVERVEADGTPLAAAGPVAVPPGRGQLEFHYAAIDLSAPEGVRFRYALEGYDSGWVEAGGRRTAYYTNLPPGRYRFRVVACNGDGVWQETPAVVDLVLRPHFYQTAWFYGLCALAAAAAVVGGHRYRTRHLRAREEELARCVADRTRRLRAEVEEHARTGELLRQSQKLEAVGQLAGGVAHDFNNLLTVIKGYAHLLLAAPDREAGEREMLLEMLAAGHRAADLTRQLLAFSRRQVLALKVLDPNAVVADMERLLKRAVGEDVALTTAFDPAAFLVKADPVQLQQVLINLCVNARDAMPRGGCLRIETRNVALGPDSAKALPGAEPGAYVLLEVSDTGCGMTPELRARVFEPFFTTKGPGKGTGLGLATVYGIVRQSGGHVTVASEVGIGTTFQIYLPRAEGEPAPLPPPPAVGSVPRGAGTVLLVEDEPSVRAVARHLLLACGYRVLEAEDGLDGLRVARAHDGRIELLVSDVVMPHLGGRQLAEELRKERADLRVLFVSGYTDDVVLHHGVSEAEVAFLQKPYSPAALASTVRAILDGTLSAPAAPERPEEPWPTGGVSADEPAVP